MTMFFFLTLLGLIIVLTFESLVFLVIDPFVKETLEKYEPLIWHYNQKRKYKIRKLKGKVIEKLTLFYYKIRVFFSRMS